MHIDIHGVLARRPLTGLSPAVLVLAGLLAACGSDATSPPRINPACTDGLLTLAPGQVVTPISASAVCVSAAAAGEYALIPYNASTVPSGKTSITVQDSGTTTVASTVLMSSGVSDLSVSSSAPLAAPIAPALRLDARMRQAERRLTPRLASARQWFATRHTRVGGARLDVIPSSVTVGQLLTLNANADSDCTSPDMRTGRVVAITQRAIVVADTSNPTGGYTDADYQSIGVTFDTLIDPVDTKAFGQPTDIDNNGHVLLFFTSAVNQMTPAGSQSFVGGFFHPRDLFPPTSSDPSMACPASNYGEMFYLLVPDPTGTIHGNKFSASEVTSLVNSTIAHEYQHLINASRRLYVNPGVTDFEEVWLNEGLSHIAEELFFYARTHLTPRQDISVNTLRQSNLILTSYNEDASQNLGRYLSFLDNPSANSPYADNDSLATRGATWSFLRYAADRAATTDGDIWFRLVNSTTTGLDNLRQVFGSNLPDYFRDWATSVLMDDLSGAAAVYQQKSWNFRSIYDAIPSIANYPLAVDALTPNAAKSVSIAGGSAAYLLFDVGAGQIATLSWGSVPSTIQMTVVRMR